MLNLKDISSTSLPITILVYKSVTGYDGSDKVLKLYTSMNNFQQSLTITTNKNCVFSSRNLYFIGTTYIRK